MSPRFRRITCQAFAAASFLCFFTFTSDVDKAAVFVCANVWTAAWLVLS
jgi:hypothetical protein